MNLPGPAEKVVYNLLVQINNKITQSDRVTYDRVNCKVLDFNSWSFPSFKGNPVFGFGHAKSQGVEQTQK